MAKVTSPLHSSEARGRLGGIQFNTWRGISFVKDSSSPAQPRTKLQLQIRAWTTYLVRKWATLTAGNRTAWNDYAATHQLIDWTGNPKRISGLNWYVKCSINLLRPGCALVATPPVTAAPDAPEGFDANAGILQSVVNWTVMAGTDKLVEVWAFGPHSAGAIAKIERARYRNGAAGEGGTVTVTGLTPGTYTFFGRTIDEENGLASPWVSDTAIITAV